MKLNIRIFLITIILQLPITLFAKTYLVAVGISDYPGTRNDLLHAVKDARDFAALYSGSEETEYCLLTNEKATSTNIYHAMSQLFSKAAPFDRIILFFSGHGLASGLRAYDATMSYDKIIGIMGASPAKNKIVMADACYSGKLRDDKSGGLNFRGDNVVFFLSSRNGEQSLESKKTAHGVFTTHLLAALKGDADRNGDRIVTAREVFDYVHAKVKNHTKNRQHPVMWGSYSDNMPIMHLRKSA